MAKKVFEVRVNYTELTYGSCYVYVEAETKVEAEELFLKNAYDYDWEGWEQHDSEMQYWEIDDVEYDEFMTKRLQEKEQLDNITNKMSHEDMDD